MPASTVMPSFKDSFGLADLIDYRATEHPKEPFAVLAADGSSAAKQVTRLEFARACHRFAYAVATSVPVNKGEVVGLLISCDTIMYVTAIAGLIRVGLTVCTGAQFMLTWCYTY